MEFKNIDIEGDISEFSEDELRKTLVDVTDAHDSNAEFVESLANERDDATDSLEGVRDDMQEYKEKLAGEIAPSVPLTEEELAEFSLSRLHDMSDDLSFDDEDEGEDPEDDEEEGNTQEGGEFGSRDRAEVSFTEEEVDSRARDGLSNISGIVID